MTSTRLLAVLTALAGAGALQAGFAHAHGSHGSVSWTHAKEPLASCDDLHVTFDGRDAVVRTEERTVTRAEAPTLWAKTGNGGLQVQGWDKDVYSVQLCKAAAPGADAETRLSETRLSVAGGHVTVSGPPRDDAVATYLLVHAPRSSTLDLEAANGPIGLYDVQGAVTARTVNGPLTARDCSGEMDLSAKNGPVSSEGNAGHLRLQTQNGPIRVALEGERWSGAGLEAHAQNGPVNLHVPPGYKSGVVVESDGNGPFACHSSVCSEGRRTWNESGKRVELGSGPALVHISAGNGPVVVN